MCWACCSGPAPSGCRRRWSCRNRPARRPRIRYAPAVNFPPGYSGMRNKSPSRIWELCGVPFHPLAQTGLGRPGRSRLRTSPPLSPVSGRDDTGRFEPGRRARPRSSPRDTSRCPGGWVPAGLVGAGKELLTSGIARACAVLSPRLACCQCEAARHRIPVLYGAVRPLIRGRQPAEGSPAPRSGSPSPMWLTEAP